MVQEILTCTRVLNLMTILGFMANYMLRVNLSIAIVDMLDPHDHAENFDWTIVQKNELLGSFFWGYILTDVIGGRLSEILGPRLIFGGGMLAGSCLTVLTPWACRLHYYAAFALRLMLGLFLGLTYPSIYPLAVKWIPPGDRSKFIANMLSQGLGVAVSLPMCGYLISVWGWTSVFYVTGSLGVLWSCSWFYLVYDSPGKHPRISTEERERIEMALRRETARGIKTDTMGDTTGDALRDVTSDDATEVTTGNTTEYTTGNVTEETIKEIPTLPWKQLLLSAPVWAIVVAHAGIAYCQFLNITQLPTYMQDVLHFDVKQNGWWSSVPNLGQYLVALAAGFAGDRLLTTGRHSKLTVRRLFACLTFFLPAAIGCGLARWGDRQTVAICALAIAFSSIGFASSGHLPNGLDISPNFCGTIMGVATMAGSAAGWLATKTVAVLTRNDRGFDGWQNVFWTMTGVNLIAGATFITLGRVDVQKWNDRVNNNDKDNDAIEM